jgi:Protein of unknown function (DUF4238)
MREDIPDHVCFENHYHTLDFSGIAPDALERLFADYEAPACALFRELAGNPARPFRSENEIEIAFNFLSLQAARVPLSKAKFETLIQEGGRTFMHEIAHNQEFFDKGIELAQRNGDLIDADRDSLREAVETGAINVHADNGHLALGILRVAAAILEKISSMRVTFCTRTALTGLFVQITQLVSCTRSRIQSLQKMSLQHS